MKKIFKLSVLLNLVFILAGGFVAYKYVNMKKYAKESGGVEYKVRASTFEQLDKDENGKIEFLGDSLTAFNQWNEAFNNNQIINRGIGGDTTDGVAKRLNSDIDSKPQKLFLMIGINDLSTFINKGQVIDNYKKMLNKIKSNSPSTKIYLEGILPINNTISKSKVKNDDITYIDKELKKIAAQDNITYINLHDKFASNGQLNPSLTIDGIHLNSKGYLIWENAINKYVQ